MEWMLVLLALAGCFAASISLYLHRKNGRLKFQGLFWASLFFILVNIGLLLEPVFTDNIPQFIINQVIEWGQVYLIAFVLSALLLFVRESKPEFSQFPILYVSFPFAIILSYLFVYNTILLKKWLMYIYQGGAALVGVMIYGIYSYRKSIYRTNLIGAGLFLITFLLHLLLPTSYKIVWQIFLFVSIISLFSGYLVVANHFNSEK